MRRPAGGAEARGHLRDGLVVELGADDDFTSGVALAGGQTVAFALSRFAAEIVDGDKDSGQFGVLEDVFVPDFNAQATFLTLEVDHERVVEDGVVASVFLDHTTFSVVGVIDTDLQVRIDSGSSSEDRVRDVDGTFDSETQVARREIRRARLHV